jgi:hypothetical protein
VAKSLKRETKALVREAKRQGFRVRETKNGWMLLAPDGVNSVTIHKTQATTVRCETPAPACVVMVSGSPMEYRITVTLAEFGQPALAAETMDRIVDAIERVHPEVGAVASANSDTGTLDVIYALDADVFDAVAESAPAVFVDGMSEAGLVSYEIVHGEIDLVGEREQVPA